jgi:hypothetical protein
MFNFQMQLLNTRVLQEPARVKHLYTPATWHPQTYGICTNKIWNAEYRVILWKVEEKRCSCFFVY